MDFILYDYKMILERCADVDYKEDVTRAAISLMRFLVDNELLVGVAPFNEDGSLKEDLVIRKSNVTEEGLQLFLKPVNSWWNALDRGTSPEKITILEKGLHKIRAAAKE